MKQIKLIAVLFLLFVINSFNSFAQTSIAGAWSRQEGAFTIMLLFQDGYHSYTKYDTANKVFSHTKGGTYSVVNNQLSLKFLFHTGDKYFVGTETKMEISITQQSLSITSHEAT